MQHIIDEWQQRVQQASAERVGLRLRGGGSKDWYGQQLQGELLDTRAYAGIVAYEPSELVITARCGTPLAELEAALAEKGQMLAFEPPHFAPAAAAAAAPGLGGGATVGGMLAAGLAGPARASQGCVRDYLLGVQLLDGRGQVLNFGGQVMKNVAGYDVSRVMAGSMGVLGLILQASLKVMPRPQAQASLQFEMDEPRALQAMNQWATQPLPISASSWHDGVLHLRLSGAQAAVQAACQRLGGQVLDEAQAAAHWHDLREQRHRFFQADAQPISLLWRLSLPSTTPTLILPGKQLIEWGGAQRWLSLTGMEAVAQQQAARTIRQVVAASGGHATLFRTVGATAAHDAKGVGVFHPLSPALMKLHTNLKAALDPAGIFNPGRLYSELTSPGVDVHTELAAIFQGTPDGERAKDIIGACVHCGFCSATCPTYQLLGDELDSPRGRIYLMKQVLEGAPASASTQLHLDRCLTCRNCETTCPSGVEYGHLLDIGRKVVEQQVPRTGKQKLLRQTLLQVLPRPKLVTPLLKMGYVLRPLLPDSVRQKLPLFTKPKRQDRAGQQARPKAGNDASLPGARTNWLDGTGWPTRAHPRRMLILDGCVQPGMAPNINAATARVFDALGVQLIRAPKAACCGALRLHLNAHEAALDDMRRNIDAWWPYIDGAQPVEAILMTASGCGVTVKEYGYLLANDPAYAHKAAHVARLTRDVSEVLPQFESALQALRQQALAQSAATRADQATTVAIEKASMPAATVAYHPPCTLQHGQQLRGQVEGLLRALGVEVKLPQESHLCCGSAGTYSILQPELSSTLRENKLRNLAACLQQVHQPAQRQGMKAGEKLAAQLSGQARTARAQNLPTGDKPPQCIVSGNIGCLTHLQAGTPIPVRHWIELVDELIDG